MSEIKRYEPINIDGTCGLCAEDPDGAYVDYCHLAALQAELAALKRLGHEADLMEPVYQFQWREIGEGDWMACSHSWFRFCEASPEHDTRVVEVARPAQTEQQPAYVECRECTDCGHVGINDAHQTDATCAMCDWSGPSPVEDQCPDCGKENAMGAACPKCSGRYRILAETHVAAPIAQTAPQGKFRMGDIVKKSTGSEWEGRVVGWYSTEQTKEGYAVESEAHAGSVQIYPAKALEAVDD